MSRKSEALRSRPREGGQTLSSLSAEREELQKAQKIWDIGTGRHSICPLLELGILPMRPEVSVMSISVHERRILGEQVESSS